MSINFEYKFGWLKAGWPTKDISGQSLARWSREPDYGICIRTTSVRGLDVDITDPVLAQEVRD